MGWRWVWLGGWVTGYGMHWATTSRNPWALTVLLLAATGALPLVAQRLASKRTPTDERSE